MAGEDRRTARSQDQCHRVKQGIRHVLGTWTELKRGDEFVAGPEATHTHRSRALSRKVVKSSSERRRMRATTHGTIVGRAWLEGGGVLRLGDGMAKATGG
jgi:hypothetical protein